MGWFQTLMAASSGGIADGYDIFLLAGQSNMAGRGTYNSSIDTTDPKVFQYGGYPSGGNYRTIVPAADRLTHPEIGTISSGVTLVGPGMFFGKAYAAATGRKVLLVPAAWGGTAMATGVAASNPWSPFGADPLAAPTATGESNLYWNAINETNRAITAAKAALSGSRFRGVLWCQGEGDGSNNVTQATYETALSALIAGFRANINEAADSLFIIQSMLPEAIQLRTGTYPQIDAAHKRIASITQRVAFFSIGTGYNSGDNLHYDAAGERLNGSTAYTKLAEASTRLSTVLPGQVLSLTSGAIGSSTVPLSWVAPSTGGTVDDYIVEYKEASSGTWLTFTDGVSTNPLATVSGLTASTSYNIRVSAKNSTGVGTPSDTVTVSTTAAATLTNVRMTSLTGILEQADAVSGWDYGCNSGATFAANHAGVSSHKLPAGADGFIQWTLDSTFNAGRNWMLGIVTSQSDPAYNTGASGYKYAVYPASTQYSLKQNGSATTVNPTTILAPATGDIMRLRRASGVWVAEVARAASPTVFTTVYTFATVDNNDAWFAISANSTTGTGIYNGPIVGGNVT